MARSISTIQTSILDAIAADPNLKDRLTSPSRVSVFRLLAYVVAVVHAVLETNYDRHAADVDAALARGKYGTETWYAEEMLKFQQGDTLVADDEGIHYAPGSTGAQLITRAAAKTNAQTNQLFIKIAKDGATPGSLAPLSGAELTQARGYLDRKQLAGVNLVLVSREADRLRLEGTIYYDPLIDLDTASTGFKARTRAALLAYLAALPFTGLVNVAKVEDAIQGVAGYKDVELTRVSARAGQAAAVVFTREYETQAGYIVEDDAQGAGFLDTLVFAPYATV
jgi:hypothetical protein